MGLDRDILTINILDMFQNNPRKTANEIVPIKPFFCPSDRPPGNPSGWGKYQGPDSIQGHRLTSIGNPIVEIRRSYDRLISTMGFPILVRRDLYIESGPRKHLELLPLVILCSMYSKTVVESSPTQRAKALGSTSITYRPDTWASDRYLGDFAFWVSRFKWTYCGCTHIHMSTTVPKLKFIQSICLLGLWCN